MFVKGVKKTYKWLMQSRYVLGAVSLLSAASVPVYSELPVGMNINGLNYYTSGIIFTDVMTTASGMMTHNGGGEWNSGKIDQIPRDESGYPEEIPYTVDGNQERVHFMINNYYEGRYVILYDGTGTIEVNAVESGTTDNGNIYLDLTGEGGHVWLNIEESQSGDHIRNISILPQEYETNPEDAPLFLEKFLQGLEPFHALRFMDWMSTNNSEQMYWSDRTTPDYYTQSVGGICIEYAIELCNTLNVDAWFCVPHKADDEYIRNFARLADDSLEQDLKIYVEYSNEVWNWMFSQANYVLENAPDHPDTYVTEDLAAIDPGANDHPEKDAYMMQRTFRLFKEEIPDSDRLVRVATGQHAWVDNTRRILTFLFKHDEEGTPVSGDGYEVSTGAGCDMFSVAGYFNYGEDDHNKWLDMCENQGTLVTPEEILDSVEARYPGHSGQNTRETAEYVNAFGVEYSVYEGGQHMQPWQQGEWCYNQSVWDAQVHPDMYEMYMTNFDTHSSDSVDCRLFMAFSYVGEKESRYGSWGHLETYSQLDSNLMEVAPKYQALLDVNTSKQTGIEPGRHRIEESHTPKASLVNGKRLMIDFSGFVSKGKVDVRAADTRGRLVYSSSKEIRDIKGRLDITGLRRKVSSGVYFIKIVSGKRELLNTSVLMCR